MANEHLTMSQAEMLATIVNNADDDADVSHLTHSEAELWGAFYNIATSGNYPYPHLDLSTAELMAGIANGYGGDVSHLTSSPDALGAAIANALGADPPVSSLASGFGAILSSILESGVVPPTEPVTPNGPVGQAVNDTSGVFTFNAPSKGSTNVNVPVSKPVACPIGATGCAGTVSAGASASVVKLPLSDHSDQPTEFRNRTCA